MTLPTDDHSFWRYRHAINDQLLYWEESHGERSFTKYFRAYDDAVIKVNSLEEQPGNESPFRRPKEIFTVAVNSGETHHLGTLENFRALLDMEGLEAFLHLLPFKGEDVLVRTYLHDPGVSVFRNSDPGVSALRNSDYIRLFVYGQPTLFIAPDQLDRELNDITY